jgi:hypothetical protein
MEEDSLVEATDSITSVKGSLIDDRTLFDVVKDMEEQFELMMRDIREVKALEKQRRIR